MKNLYWKIRDRNFGIYSIEEQKQLRKSNICVVGLGCVGELAALILVRIGVGNISIVDYDELKLINLNRNAYSFLSLVGKYKTKNIKNIIKDVDSSIKVKAINQKVTITNGEAILKNHDVVLQLVDDMASRIIVHRVARRLSIPCITMSGAPPFRAFVTSIMPEGISYEKLFNLPTVHLTDFDLSNEKILKDISLLRKERAQRSLKYGAIQDWISRYVNGEREIWAITPQRAYITAVLVSHEAIKILLNKDNIVSAPLIIDINLDRFPNLIKIKKPYPNKSWDYKDF